MEIQGVIILKKVGYTKNFGSMFIQDMEIKKYDQKPIKKEKKGHHVKKCMKI